MSGPHYSVIAPITTILDASNAQTFFDELKIALLAVGWTVVHGITLSGITGYQFKSYPTPGGAQVLLNASYSGFATPFNGHPILNFEMDTLDETHTTLCGQVTIALFKKNRIICGPHQFFIFYDEDYSPAFSGLDRDDACGGVPYRTIDDGSSIFWAAGSDTSFRYNMYAGNADYNGFYDGFNWRHNTSNADLMAPLLLGFRSTILSDPVPTVLDTYGIIEPLLLLGARSGVKHIYSLWDAIVVGQHFSTKVTALVDYRLYEAFTIKSSAEVTACLFLVSLKYDFTLHGAYAH